MKTTLSFQTAVSVTVCFLLFAGAVVAETDTLDYQAVLSEIKSDLSKLGGEFPQLRDFPDRVEYNAERLSISYAYHTHEPKRRGGWTAGVPNPDADGIWFYIDFHDPGSSAQIHTQPVTAPLCIGSRKVSFLILEGKKTKPVSGKIRSILNKHGVSNCL